MSNPARNSPHFDAPSTPIGSTIIISRPTTALRSLPAPTAALFAERPPWSVVSTSGLTAALHADHGSWHVWRSRRITPSPLPEVWFRRASGAPLYYRIDTVLGWLASRHGEPFDVVAAWDVWLRTRAGLNLSSWDEVRSFACQWAKNDGPVLDDGAIKFTNGGFAAYLAALGEAQ